MVGRFTRLALTIFCCFTLLSVGCASCGDNGGTDTGADADTMADTGVEDTMDTTEQNDGGDAQNQHAVRPEYKVEDRATCDDSPPPQRCGEDPWAYTDWSPASVVTKLDLTSKDAEDCCFDINYDGEPDNALKRLLDILGLGGIDVGAEIKKNIVANQPYSDDLILLTEHRGLESFGQSNPFTINFLLGAYANQSATEYLRKEDSACNIDNEDCPVVTKNGKSFNVDPRSFEGGTKAQAQVPDGTFPTSDSNVKAGPGKVVLNISVPRLGQISLTINGATIDADIDKANSDLSDGGDGVVITEGRLGGYVLGRDVIGLINRVLGTCDCLNLSSGENAVTYPLQDQQMEADLEPNVCSRENPPEDQCGVSCKSSVKMRAENECSGQGGLCGNASLVCGNLGSIIETFDLDVDGDGHKDSLSAGALFETVGAKIEGVSSIIETEDQTVSGGSVTVPRAFVTQKAWVVIHEDDGSGNPGAVIGHSNQLNEGWNEGITVNFDSGVSVSDGDTLHAMLHVDNGTMGTYEFSGSGSNDPPMTSGLGNVIVESFTVSK